MPAARLFKVLDALTNTGRIDRKFLPTILLKHSSRLAVLAAPEKFRLFTAPTDGVAPLFKLLLEQFTYVVMDAGPTNKIQETLLDAADTLYLATEMRFPALRNAHCLLSVSPHARPIPRAEYYQPVRRATRGHRSIERHENSRVVRRLEIPSVLSAARAA